MVRGSVGYLDVFITLPPALVMGIFTLLLVGIAIWGMKESALLITLITLLEVGGLIVAIYISSDLAPVLSWSEILMPPIDTGAWLGISIGAYLAFYAFIGFEDMVTVAEEVTDVERAMPRAIIIVMVLATVLYVGVGIAALRVMPVADLAASSAPFADLISRAGQSPVFITLISLIAIINGALVQIIMASRMLYGMGQEALAPKFLSVVHHKRQTPHVASLMAGVVVLAFALFLPLVTLAKLTSSIILMVFTLVNLALVRLRLRDGVPDDAFNLPLLVPIIGALLSLTLFLWPFIGEVVGVGH
jgi:amino acid transporter